MPRLPLSEQEIERNYRLIEDAALKGERAPQTQPHGPLNSRAVSALYRSGRIRGEIFPKNFRRFTILTGPQHGKCTAAPPAPAKPYRVIDHCGSLHPGRLRKIAP